MNFNLQISVTGLCLFVPSDDGSSVSVVLPRPKGMPHTACIFYDRGHNSEVDAKPTYDFDSIDLSGDITLPGGTTPAGTNPSPPITPKLFTDAFVADVGAGAKADNGSANDPDSNDPDEFKVPKRFLSSADPDVVAVITMPGGRLLSSSASAPWYYPDGQGPRALAWKVEWLIENITTADDFFTLTVDGKSYRLFPIDGTVGLRVKHVPPEEAVAYDPLFSSTRQGAHFMMFYHMLKSGKMGSVPSFGHKPGGKFEVKGSLTTCTPGVAEPAGA